MDHSNRLEELVTRYENTLFRTALAILGDVPEAEDAVQDAFVRYLEKRPAFRDAGHERAWLLKVTANGCKSRLRARRRHPWVELLDVYPAPEDVYKRQTFHYAYASDSVAPREPRPPVPYRTFSETFSY